MKTVMLVFGTRPEAIKMCPLVNELKTRKNINTYVCVTGQHREMLAQVLNDFGVVPDCNLDIMKERQTLFDITTSILQKIRTVLEDVKPDCVLVHGDTSTTFVTALACFYMQIPVGHVEAGLRTYNIYSPYPEEFNRQAVGIVSAYNFAPTEMAKENLLREGKKPDSIYRKHCNRRTQNNRKGRLHSPRTLMGRGQQTYYHYCAQARKSRRTYAPYVPRNTSDYG